MRALAALALSACALLAPAAPEDDPAKGDLKRLQGGWKALSAEEGGVPAPEKEARQMRLVFTGEKFAAYYGPAVLLEGTVKLDPGKRPKAIDLVCSGGRLKGQTAPAIYELDGDGLKLCLGEPGGKRPAGFKTAKTGHHLVLYQREKKP
jgi:uncharacterized protein (TIGR03067 family)